MNNLLFRGNMKGSWHHADLLQARDLIRSVLATEAILFAGFQFRLF